MKKLLIVEDEPLLRKMYEEKLSKLDVVILSAENSREGFVITKKEKPDLVLLDMLLQEGDGIEMMEKVRLDNEIKETKFLAFSNFNEPSMKEKAMSLGAIDYLLKTDYTPNQIANIIQNILKYDPHSN